jgi:large subunit ribosomal protein L22
MTRVSAKLSALRVAPRKVRLVTDMIKGMEVHQAENQLRFTTKRSALPVLKLVRSALANAKNNAEVSEDEVLYVKDIRVDEGPVFKRSMPRARGRATMIRKKTSHISLILETKRSTSDKKVEEIKAVGVKK